MLSRSNSTAADRLRRAKSTSSAHTASSSRHQQRSSTSIDPFVARRHAETAAVEAFQRAARETPRPVPLRKTTARAAGSHFEEARLGRRKSGVRREERMRRVGGEVVGDEGSEGEVVVTRRRSVIPPAATAEAEGARSSLYEPEVGRSERRKSRAEYTDGSPAPRNTMVSGRGSGIDGPQTQYPALRDESYFPAVSESHAAQAFGDAQPDAIASAPDRHPQGSQSKKLKERKSFILAPFQRRRTTTNLQNPVGDSYDTTLPPFNYADENLPPPPPPPPPVYAAPAFNVSQEKKSRTFSDSLKGRFKKVFRKATRVPTVLPAQHIEATHLHYPVTTPLSTPTVRLEEQEDPFTVGEQSAAKSRVTSWTNSTVAGTWSTRDDVDDHDTANEQGRLKRTESTSTLRKARSFFGRPVKNKLRRASKLELRESEESTGLYSALQERIQPADSASQAAVSDAESQSVRVSSALDSLPSRQRAESTISSRGRGGGGWQAPTIRSVTPDPAAYRLDIPSPVAEVMSPDAVRPLSRQEETNNESTPTSQLHRRPAMKAPTPSKEQIERRIERCKDRWQSPLDELSPSATRPTRHAMDENPYELRSLSRTLNQPLPTDLPHHARVGITNHDPSNRTDVLSPSVYSRATDGESPRPDTPAASQQGGMIVTITGREVKSYAISPAKAEQGAERPIHASSEWRRWLSDEMNGWDGSSAPQDFVLPKSGLKDSQADSTDAVVEQRQSSHNSRADSAQQVVSAIATTPEPPPTQIKAKELASRPRPGSRLSSYMNERYPMIDTGRNSSDQSVGRRSRVSSRGWDSRPETAESATATSGARLSAGGQEEKASAEAQKNVLKKPSPAGEPETAGLKTALARRRVVTKPKSVAHLASAAGSSRDENAGEADATSRSHAPAPPEAAKTNIETKRPKSALDLRANYKSSNNTTARPLEVRRKAQPAVPTDFNLAPPQQQAHHDLLEDSTILHIAAGPYAASTSPIPSSHHHHHPSHMDRDREKEKENIPPASEPTATPLPALSSSEWLAAGTSNAGRKRDLSAVHPALRDRRSVSRFSPAAVGGGTGTSTSGLNVVGNGGGGSPGQRLASSWLDGKKGSPAFV